MWLRCPDVLKIKPIVKTLIWFLLLEYLTEKSEDFFHSCWISTLLHKNCKLKFQVLIGLICGHFNEEIRLSILDPLMARLTLDNWIGKQVKEFFFTKHHLAFLQLSSGKSTLSDGNDEAKLRQVLFN